MLRQLRITPSRLRRPVSLTVRPRRALSTSSVTLASPSDMSNIVTRILPECWGHRGASAAFPENTLTSFEAAIRDGAEGIETDVHVSLDDVVVMFHDPSLERTTDAKGLIRDNNWYGEGGMEHARTTKTPKQPIPTFAETVALLMKPENQHVRFDVDVKPENDPPRLFALMDKIIRAHDDWETLLAPRIILGLWHPRFIGPARTHMPYCRRSYIGDSPSLARQYFWHACEIFSMSFPSLSTIDGIKFRRECKAAGKSLMVWTVNNPAQMMEAVRWGVDVILTDRTKAWLAMRAALAEDYDTVSSQYKRTFLWTTPSYYSAVQYALILKSKRQLERVAGSFDAHRAWQDEPPLGAAVSKALA